AKRKEMSPGIGHFRTAAMVAVRPGQPVPELIPEPRVATPRSGTVSGTIGAIVSCPYGHRARPRLKARPSATVRQGSGSRRGARHLLADLARPTGRALSDRTGPDRTRSPRFLPIRRQLPSAV